MSISRAAPVQIIQPNPRSKSLSDRLHIAVLRGKIGILSKLLDCGVHVELTNLSGQTPLFCSSFLGHLEITKLLLKHGADPNRRCSIFSCTPVHAACFSGNVQVLSAVLVAGGDLRFHDQHNRLPRDWALMQKDSARRLATLSMIESFRQMAIKGCDLNVTGVGLDLSTRSHSTFKLPAKLRNTLASLGLMCSENCDYIGPFGNIQGTGFGKVLYGRGESAAALWPVPLVDESQLSDPDDDFCEMEAALNGLLPRGVAYRVGPSTEMVPRKWLQTAVSVRRLKENHPPDILFEELHSMSRLRHPGLLLLLGVSSTQHWESVQLIYEPVYQGSLHYRLHIMGSSVPLLKRLMVLQQMCDALLFLHSKNLLHCSITSHAVHLISTSRAKLGCLETLIDDGPPSKRVYRKVPASHWDWTAPWVAPECARGEGVSALSDVYSFCCLVWETCNVQVPWSPLTSKEINEMWQKKTQRMLPISDAVPVHVGSFLKLGLQPALEQREEMDLQEIYLMLRLQAAALAHNQQKETHKSTGPPSKMPPSQPTLHHWGPTPKERIDKNGSAAEPSREGEEEDDDDDDDGSGEDDEDETSEIDVAYADVTQQNIHVHDDREQISPPREYADRRPVILPTKDRDDDQSDTCKRSTAVRADRQDFVEPVQPLFLDLCTSCEPLAGTRPTQRPFAIKPASHMTEHHSANCIMKNHWKSEAGGREAEASAKTTAGVKSYSAFTHEMRQAVAQPPKFHHGLVDFETWRLKMEEDAANETVGIAGAEEPTDESGEEVGDPTFSSTPRNLSRQKSVSFLACSSRLLDDAPLANGDQGGAKPKKSPALANLTLPAVLPRAKPSTEFVASLTAIFNAKRMAKKVRDEPDTSRVSRAVQCPDLP